MRSRVNVTVEGLFANYLNDIIHRSLNRAGISATKE